jgi:uracil-DNA glycosylase family 4
MITSAEELRYIDDHAPQDFCDGCPFGGPKVGSKGDPASPIVFVAESPGLQEVRGGEPLIGPSGKLFHKFVPDDGSVYVLNAMECYPSRAAKNEKQMNSAAHCCRHRLLQKVQAHPRRIVVAMGNSATRSLTGDWGHKITQIRGRLIPSPLAELGIMPIVHIAALMKGTGSFRQWREDVTYAMELGLGAEPRQHLKADVFVVPTVVGQGYIDALFENMLVGSNELAGDIETTGFDHIRDQILSVGVTPGNKPEISYCFYPHHFQFLKPWLESEYIQWAWHNGKFDIKFLWMAGIRAHVDDDTMLLSYALDELGGVHDLETVSCDVLGAPDYKYMIRAFLPRRDSSYELIPPPVLAEYQAIDTSNTAQIRPILRNRVRDDPALERLYTHTLLPASEMLAQVEWNGICTDPKRLEENEPYFADMKAEIGAEINEMIGYSINAGSPKQVSELLFRKMKFPNRKKGSTDASVLERLQRDTEHPLFGLIMKHRKAVKMYGTYVKGLKKHVHPETNRIHATYLIHGTRTGRLSARDPNMQNPPRDPQIRGTFVGAPGYELVEVDLSQAELRSLAALSGDPGLLEVYGGDGDLHTDLANFLFPGWDERKADPATYQAAYEQRVKCKNVNFGITYGITEYGLQEQLNCALSEARTMLRGWDDRYPVAREFINKCRQAPMNGQDITTCFGRRKRVGLVSRENMHFLQNEAANFPHQSIASDITLHAGIRSQKPLMSLGVRIVNLIHDALLLEVPITADNHIRHEAICLVAHEMRQVPIDWGITRVPFIAEGEFGPRWGSLKKHTEPIYG